MARNVARTSPRVTPAATSVVARLAGADRRQRRAVDGRVLADLEPGQVEAERGHLPAQVLDLAVGDALQTVGGERRLDLRQLGVQVGRRVVAETPVIALRRVVPASGAGARR